MGTIQFETSSALAIWKCEILGQMSDGMWENTRHDWKFWGDLVASVGETNLAETKYVPYDVKTGFNIAALYDIIGDRMLAQGRMGRAIESTHLVPKPEFFVAMCIAAEYLPPTYGEFVEAKALISAGKPGAFTYKYEYIALVDLRFGEAFYNTKYEMKDLRADVKRIKTAIKSVAKYRR